MENFTGRQFGNYRLIRHLGTGGFGEVYLGRHIHIQREAAIKILLKLEPDEIEQFRREAQIIANLTHPRIVTIFDYDVEGETPFIVMQYAEQGTLRGRYRRGTRAPLAEVVKYITQAADGLQFAHDHRIIHRDIKPENMLLGPGSDLLLSDFGIAVVWSSTRSVGVQNASGTLAYMPPEQILRHPRAASDQYSLAVTAYEWLSGERPLAGSKLGLGMVQMQSPEIKAPALPQFPQQLNDVLQRALASDWQARFPTVREFAQEFERAASANFYGPTEYAPLPRRETPQIHYAPVQSGFSTIQYPPPPQEALSPVQYAPPPPVSYPFTPGVQSYTPAPAAYMAQPQQASSKAFSLFRMIFSIIGMIVGGLLAALGIFGIFTAPSEPQQFFGDLAIGGLIAFFGIMIFFIARIRRSPFPVPKARKIESIIGMVTAGIAILYAIGVIIAAANNPRANYGYNSDLSYIIAYCVMTIIFGVIIWLVTRVRIKKTS